MRKILLYMSLGLITAALALSCKKTPAVELDQYVPVENLFDDAVPSGYYGYAQISVPAATRQVYIQYTYRDGSTQTIEKKVKPVVAQPEGGKDVEPFGTVSLNIQSAAASRVSVYYHAKEATKGSNDDVVYTLQNFPIDQITSGEFGKTRYVQVQWNFAWKNDASTQYQNTPTYPADVVFYDAAHNHTLRYTFAYSGLTGEGYVLTDAYEVVDHVVTNTKYNYCKGCGNCPFCMPWGCSCGCGGWDANGQPIEKPNPNFVPSGDTTASAGPEDIVVDPSTPGSSAISGGGVVTVTSSGSIVVSYAPANTTSVTLPEPAPYVTTDGDFTMYHSSGVVMFDDSWPNFPAKLGDEFNGAYDFDFNDLVVDYDIEAVTVADSQLEEQSGREQLKVVLHVRAVGGDRAWRAGLVLENFDMDYVEKLEEYKTLDSYSSGHGELPTWTIGTLQENSLHYDPLATQFATNNPLRPSIEIGGLQRINGTGSSSRSGTEVYYYVHDDEAPVAHVMNPALKQWSEWGGAHTDQYDGVMAQIKKPYPLSQLQNYKFYNTIPGYVNQAGGLYTYTVIYKIKDRAQMTPEESQKCLANLVDAVVNTTAQNFFMVKQDYGAVGLKGYQPLDYSVKDYKNGYKSKYDQIVAGSSIMSATTTYVANNGQVWGFKCPTLTKHAWEKMPFSLAYPDYEAWLQSGGTQHADWYLTGNDSYLSCQW